MKIKYWLLFFSVGMVCFAQAEDKFAPSDLKQTISRAITEFEQTDRTRWSYQVSRYENEEGDITRSVEQYHPSKNVSEEWSLISLNGNQPTQKQIQKFVDKKQKNATDKENKSLSLLLKEIIQVETVKFESENDDYLTASFNVDLSRLVNASEKLIGSLTFNKEHQFIESIEITNLAAFSPMFSAKITDFKLSFSFLKIDDAILAHEQRLNMQGTFAFFTEILEESKDVFSNYQYIKEPYSE